MERKMMEEAAAECESKEKDEKLEETQEKRDEEGFLSPEEIQHRYSASSLCRITTQVLKVLNATEELLQGVEGGDEARPSSTSLPPNTDAKKLDQQFSTLEENVYVAAGSVFGLEAELMTWRSVPGESAAPPPTWSCPSWRSRWRQLLPRSNSRNYRSATSLRESLR
ncbi:unnamed protein product [Pleuronectes platessa]|uniref:Rab effector MyRIP/Melanophilin domain-containing protein n=1 Tax=Pleuronectes platessa TaxID=8262 RepID=A0A9N7U0B0_PLEPL|nr:unnamed protein product [Pleuronectes platessa]